ncbi:mitochondrial import inner membrane translocase subunit Tim21 [Lucilia sericata]|uniref:mitochondrial import inner membrane translocase subunit Tim21 n=1 Tax=Lucilia sericata TaxID=13632 RepID=UPI0018A7F944|nr:mitochondrial import inner membrane translocase subunit Tim21 [Lucilia sericata]
MSQLILLRQVLQKQQHLQLKHLFQLQQIKKISQCAVWQQKAKRSETGQELQLSKSGAGRTDVSTDVRPLGEKIKETTKTASYTAIILAGVGVTAVMFWAIFRELFSSSSPNNIYSDALERVIEDPRVQDSLGAPIKGFGEESRRGRRQHVAHSSFERNGVPHIRMRFYVQGIRNKATVHLESRRAPSGKMEYRYLFVQLDHYPHTTIILEDNRAFDPVPSTSSNPTSQTPLTGSSLSFASFDGKN